MRFLKAGLVLLVSALILASASLALAALPDVHILSGEEYPAEVEGFVNGAFQGEVIGKLETELNGTITHEELTFTEMKLSLELLKLSSSGPDTLVLTGVVEPTSHTSCHTTGAPEGTVVIPGEYHVVTALDVTEIPREALLLLFKELVIECKSGKFKVKVRAPWLARLHVFAGIDVTFASVTANCVLTGRQELREYINDEERAVKGQLTANFGLGFEPACMELKLALTLGFTKMVDFLF